MALGLVGRKSGMTRIFTEDGASIPVSVVEVEPNRITQVKTHATDGYDAIQVTAGTRRASRVNKTAAGHFCQGRIWTWSWFVGDAFRSSKRRITGRQ